MWREKVTGRPTLSRSWPCVRCGGIRGVHHSYCFPSLHHLHVLLALVLISLWCWEQCNWFACFMFSSLLLPADENLSHLINESGGQSLCIMEPQKLRSAKTGRGVFRSRESDTGLSPRKFFIKMHLERSGKERWVRGFSKAKEEWGSEGKHLGPLSTHKHPAQTSDHWRDKTLVASSFEDENKWSLWDSISRSSEKFRLRVGMQLRKVWVGGKQVQDWPKESAGEISPSPGLQT